MVGKVQFAMRSAFRCVLSSVTKTANKTWDNAGLSLTVLRMRMIQPLQRFSVTSVGLLSPSPLLVAPDVGNLCSSLANPSWTCCGQSVFLRSFNKHDSLTQI